MTRPVFNWIALTVFAGLLMACNPRTNLNEDNLLKGARAETFILSHGALCARLPSPEAIEQYARDQVPSNSAVAREVKAWDLSGLLDIFQTRDGRWVIMPSSGLKNWKVFTSGKALRVTTKPCVSVACGLKNSRLHSEQAIWSGRRGFSAF